MKKTNKTKEILIPEVERITIECNPETRHTVDTFDDCYSEWPRISMYMAIVTGRDENGKEVLDYLKRGRPSKEGFIDVSRLRKGMVVKAGKHDSHRTHRYSSFAYYLVESSRKDTLVLIKTIGGENVTYLRAKRYLKAVREKRKQERLIREIA